MKPTLFGAALISMVMGQVLAVNAQNATLDWAEPLAGKWIIAGVAEGDPYCGLTLGSEAATGGAALEISATCKRNFPLAEISAWALQDGSIILIDEVGDTVVTLKSQGSVGYGGIFADDRAVTLDRGEPKVPASVEELMDGIFDLSGPNNDSACSFMVEAASLNQGNIKQEGNCPDAWADKGWSEWKYSAGVLDLLDENGATILSLMQADEFTFTTDGPDGELFFGPGQLQGVR